MSNNEDDELKNALIFLSRGCGVAFTIVFALIALFWAVGPSGLFVIGIFVAAAGVAWLSQPACPKCSARRTTYWRHRRIDGGPDRRYHNNLRCTKCDHLAIKI
jgi:hypothetical protein